MGRTCKTVAGPADRSEEAATEGPRSVRFRAFVLGFALIPPVSYACTNAPTSSMFSLLVAPVGVLLALVLLNWVSGRALRRRFLDRTDLILIFAMTSVAGAVSAEWSWVQHSAIHMFPVAAESNPVAKSHMLAHLPDWLAIKDLRQVEDMTTGGHGMAYTAQKLPIYFPKYLAWGALLCSVCFACLCINSLMRGAWCRSERLAFPLIQLPVAVTEKGGAGAMWRSKHMWLAFAIMFGIDMLNGFAFLFPNLPRIPVKDYLDLSTLFTEPPLNQMGQFPIAIYPFMAAIGLFMSNDLIFSMIFFFLARKSLHVLLAANGYPQGTFSGTFIAPGPPFFDEQTWGGVLALFLGAIWVSRGYLREVWADIRSGRSPEDGGITHRWAFVGLLASFLVVVWFGLAGTLPITYMVPYVLLFLIFSVVLTRIRAQLGPPTHEFAFFGPSSIMHRFLGNHWLSDRQAVWVNQVFISMNRVHRTHPMPYQLEAMKMGQMEHVNQKRIFFAIVMATGVGFLFASFFLHVFAYRTGAATRYQEGLAFLQSMLNNRSGADVVGIAMTLVGFSAVLGLDALRFRFPGFPLHPTGYVLSMNFGVDYYWFGLMIALVVKVFVQRYFGLPGYDKLRNVGLGILVGEYAAEAIWTTITLFTQQSTYTISFNERGLGVQ